MKMMRKLLDNIPFVACTIEKNITFTHKILTGDERLILCDTPKMETRLIQVVHFDAMEKYSWLKVVCLADLYRLSKIGYI